MEEFEFSNTVLLMILMSAFMAGGATLPDSIATRFFGVFTAVILVLVAFVVASEEAINWLAPR